MSENFKQQKQQQSFKIWIKKRAFYRPRISHTVHVSLLMLNSVNFPATYTLILLLLFLSFFIRFSCHSSQLPTSMAMGELMLVWESRSSRKKTKILNNNMNPFQFKSSIFPHRSTTPHIYTHNTVYVLLDMNVCCCYYCCYLPYSNCSQLLLLLLCINNIVCQRTQKCVFILTTQTSA